MMPRVQQKKHIRLSSKEHGDAGDGQNSLQLIAYSSYAGEKGEGDMRYAI